MKTFVLSPAAEQDLAEIETHVARDHQHAASRLLDALEAACRLLAVHPEAGRRRDEIAPGVRSFPVGSYVIFYRQLPGTVGIARVLHGSRDLPATFHDR